MKKLFKIFSVVLFLFLIVNIAGSYYFYNKAIARTSKDFLNENVDLTVATFTPMSQRYQWFDGKEVSEITIVSEDGLQLYASYLKASLPSNKTVILAHGYSSNGKDMVSFAAFYYTKLGFNVLMPDSRGHGRSEGDYIGFGWKDRKDYLQWIDYVLSLNQNTEIILHGVSMGGATVLMTSGETLPDNVKAIISDCAYTSVKDQLEYQFKRMYQFPTFPIMQSTSLLTKIKAGYFFGEASAVKQVAKSKTPILLIHGEEDSFVPFEMVHELYENTASEKDIFVVPNAGHATAFSQDQAGYETKVIEFLSRYLTN